MRAALAQLLYVCERRIALDNQLLHRVAVVDVALRDVLRRRLELTTLLDERRQTGRRVKVVQYRRHAHQRLGGREERLLQTLHVLLQIVIELVQVVEILRQHSEFGIVHLARTNRNERLLL